MWLNIVYYRNFGGKLGSKFSERIITIIAIIRYTKLNDFKDEHNINIDP